MKSSLTLNDLIPTLTKTYFLSALKPLLAVSPAMASRPEMRGVARVGELIGALERRQVDSAAALRRVWASDPSFLQREVAMWVSKQGQVKMMKMWPTVVKG